jgi:hypothetical protein
VIHLQQTVLEQSAQLAREGHYVEAWESAGSDARARTFVRYHAGDLEGALAEARRGPRDASLCAMGTDIALALHRGGVAESLLEDWRACAAPEDAPRLAAAGTELATLRATEQAAQAGIRRARWIGALALAALLLFLKRSRPLLAERAA